MKTFHITVKSDTSTDEGWLVSDADADSDADIAQMIV